jgi:hypothetical protein
MDRLLPFVQKTLKKWTQTFIGVKKWTHIDPMSRKYPKNGHIFRLCPENTKKMDINPP